MNIFFNTLHCKSKVHCRTCRDINKEGIKFRNIIIESFDIPTNVNYICPHGYTLHNLPLISINKNKKQMNLNKKRCIYREQTKEKVHQERPCMGNWIKCNNPLNRLDKVIEKQCTRKNCRFYRD